MEMPFRIPKSMTVFKSTDLDTNRFKRWAAWRVQNVTIKCQLVSVVAGSNGIKKKKTKLDMQMLINFTIDRQNYMIFEEGKKWLSPKGKPRLLIKALLQMTMETEEATERNSAPITPNWKFDISPIFSVVDIFFKIHQSAKLQVYISFKKRKKIKFIEPFLALYFSLMWFN